MKIKCPACQTVLQVPETAAGKVIKCSCGKQMRAPGGAAPAAAKPAPSAAPRPAAPAPQAPAAPQASGGGYVSPFAAPQQPQSSGILDELTDSDLAPIRAVAKPGAKAAVQKHGAATEKMLQEAAGSTNKKKKAIQGPKRPGFLTFLGVMHGLGALSLVGLLLSFLGTIEANESLERILPRSADGTLFYLIASALGIVAGLSLAACASCFSRGATAWYVVLFSYGWAMSDSVFKVVAKMVGGEDIAVIIASSAVVLLGGGAIWAWLHGKSVRGYFVTESEPVWKIVLVDIGGFVTGSTLWGVIVVMLLQ
ncbi:MAG: hypothetical protein AAFU85_02065 [Planctomycetota bacterium]